MKNEIKRCQFRSLPENESDVFDLLLSETTEGETSFLPLPDPSEKAPQAESHFQKRGKYLIYSESCEGWRKDFFKAFDSEEEARGFAYRIFVQPEILEDGDEFDSVFGEFRLLREFETGEEEIPSPVFWDWKAEVPWEDINVQLEKYGCRINVLDSQSDSNSVTIDKI